LKSKSALLRSRPGGKESFWKKKRDKLKPSRIDSSNFKPKLTMKNKDKPRKKLV
jgi:hypothetical protein